MSSPDVTQATTPGLGRRLAAFIYEGVLLFGVLMVGGLLYSSLTQQRHALQGRVGLQAFLFVLLALYFTWFWTHGGQTVAMKAWRVRVVAADGLPLTRLRALARYLFSWLWFLPSLVAVQLAGLDGVWPIMTVVAIGALAYGACCYLHPQRQFLHDALCGTRIVDVARRPVGA